MTSYIELSYADLAVASLLIVIDAALSIIFGLRIHRSLLVAAIRMTVQLALVGLVLTFLFAVASPLWTGSAGNGAFCRTRGHTAPGAAAFRLVVLRFGHRLYDDRISRGHGFCPPHGFAANAVV